MWLDPLGSQRFLARLLAGGPCGLLPLVPRLACPLWWSLWLAPLGSPRLLALVARCGGSCGWSHHHSGQTRLGTSGDRGGRAARTTTAGNRGGKLGGTKGGEPRRPTQWATDADNHGEPRGASNHNSGQPQRKTCLRQGRGGHKDHHIGQPRRGTSGSHGRLWWSLFPPLPFPLVSPGSQRLHTCQRSQRFQRSRRLQRCQRSQRSQRSQS